MLDLAQYDKKAVHLALRYHTGSLPVTVWERELELAGELAGAPSPVSWGALKRWNSQRSVDGGR